MAVPPHTPPTDADIAHAHTLEPVTTIADRAGIPPEAVIPYGTGKAKIDVARLAPRPVTFGASPIMGIVAGPGMAVCPCLST